VHPPKRSSEVGVDRFFGQLDWSGLPQAPVEESITRLATKIAPAVRAASALRRRDCSKIVAGRTDRNRPVPLAAREHGIPNLLLSALADRAEA
jgi:hypothetical protein